MKLKFERIQGNDEVSVTIINGEKQITFDYITLIKSLYTESNEIEVQYSENILDEEKEKIDQMIQDICNIMADPKTETESEDVVG